MFIENCNFGFRRNLLGLKPVGLSIALLSAIILGSRLYGEFADHRMVSPAMVTAAGLNVLFVVLWLFVFRPQWVKVPADAYAERLLESLDTLK